MRQVLRNRSWFALLRCDRLLFAVAATFLMVSHLLQPLAAAERVGPESGGTLCRGADGSFSAPAGNHEPASDHCPQCVAGPCAGLALPARDGVAVVVIPRLVRDGRKPAIRAATLPTGQAEPPPAIRAPPILV